MIKYLQDLRNKKGFTLIELIIVIAIIAVLIAITAPLFSSDDATRRAVNTYASDFFTSLQYNMTRYQKTEADLSPTIAAETKAAAAAGQTSYIKYDPTVGQNVLGKPFIYIEAYYDQGLQFVHINETLAKLTLDTSTTSNTALEKQLQNDMKELVNQASKGYYYAVVTMNANYNNLKVVTVHYTDQRVTDPTPTNLMFVDESELANGFYCGTCTGDNTSGAYVGNIKTQFLNVKDATSNAIW